MKSATLTRLLAVGCVAAAAAWAYQARRTRANAAARAGALAEAQALEGTIAALDQRWQDERETLAAVERDNAQLLEAIKAGLAASAARRANSPFAREHLEARYRRAQSLEAKGDSAGALDEYLWCYDHGYLRTRDLLTRVARLGEDFPPAMVALRQRRADAERRVMVSADDGEAMADLLALNRVLREEQQSLALHDRLPPGDARRRELARGMLEALVAARRYADALPVLPPYSQLLVQLDPRPPVSAAAAAARDAARAQIAARAPPLTDQQVEAQRIARERAQQAQHAALLKQSVVTLEVLAGTGDVARARDLVQKVIAYDNSPETRALLRHHLERAGAAGLLAEVQSP